MTTRATFRNGTLNPRPTANSDFRPYIFRVLLEMGGKGKSNEIIDRIGELMQSQLNETDYGIAATRTEPRWRIAPQWERNLMKDEGLIFDDSPRGVWELTKRGMFEARRLYGIANKKSFLPKI